MKEQISVELTGHDAAFPLDEAAGAELRRYLAQARKRLQGDPDLEEIVGDLESSIGDRLAPLLDRGDPRIGLPEMRRVLVAVGDVESGEAAPGRQLAPVQTAPYAPRRGRFFCRIQQGSWMGGICLGIAAYGDFRVDWVRTVFILLGLVTGGLLIVAYLIAMLLLPAVPTVAEYELQRDAPGA